MQARITKPMFGKRLLFYVCLFDCLFVVVFVCVGFFVRDCSFFFICVCVCVCEVGAG